MYVSQNDCNVDMRLGTNIVKMNAIKRHNEISVTKTDIRRLIENLEIQKKTRFSKKLTILFDKYAIINPIVIGEMTEINSAKKLCIEPFINPITTDIPINTVTTIIRVLIKVRLYKAKSSFIFTPPFPRLKLYIYIINKKHNLVNRYSYLSIENFDIL